MAADADEEAVEAAACAAAAAAAAAADCSPLSVIPAGYDDL